MLASLSSKAIMTKAKAMYGKRLTEADYQEMLHKKSVVEVAEYLRSATAYGEGLSSIQPSTIHRGQLENMLHKTMFNRYMRLMRFNTEIDDNYYRYLITQVEIDQILQMVRLLNAGHPEDYITQYPEFIDRYAPVSFMKLAHVRNFDGLLEVLRDSPYGGLMMKCRPVGGEQINYTTCEVELMNYYYRYIETNIDKAFHGKTKRELHTIFNTIVEMKNIGTIYRLKRYFPASSREYIKSCLLPHWNIVPEPALDALIATKDADEFIKRLIASPYARFLGAKDYVFIENSGDRIICRMNKRFLRFATSAPVAFTAYMLLGEIEFSNIICVIEGIRYGVAPAEIAKLLVT